jgi:hypothetical protein
MPQISKEEIENLARVFCLYATLPKDLWPQIELVEKHQAEHLDLQQELVARFWDIMTKRGINVDVPGYDYERFLKARQEELASRAAGRYEDTTGKSLLIQ